MNRESREITSVGDWLDWRRQDITASRIAALFDCHPFLDRERLAAELRGQNSQITVPAMRRGRILEPAVLAALAEDHPDWQITKATTYHRLSDHRLGATPDAFVGEDGLIQIKTVSPQEFDNWRGRIPLAYTLQTLTELLVTGRERGVLAVMVCSSSFPVHEFDVPRHPEAEAKILAAVAEWWSKWEAGEIAGPAPSIAPDLDDGSHLDLSGDNRLGVLLPERAGLKAAVSTAEARLKEIDAEIKDKIGAARTAWCDGWLIKYPTLTRREYTVKAGTYRRLEIAEKDNADV